MCRADSFCAFLFSFFLIFVLHLFFGKDIFFYDAEYYWSLADNSNFFEFPLSMRGYLYPWVLAPIKFLCILFNSLIPLKISFALVYAFGFSVILPGIYKQLTGVAPSFRAIIVLLLAFMVLFPGLLIYPLSDLPALLFLGLSLHLILLVSDNAVRRSWIPAILAGVALYASYNTRTIYLVAVPFIVLLFVLSIPKIGIRVFLCFMFGVLIAAIPQMIVNKKHLGSFSPMVSASAGGKSLTSMQLVWGLQVQKYETSVHSTSGEARVFYQDDAGLRLLKANRIDGIHFGNIEYMRLSQQNPVAMLGLLGRHLINGLNVQDNFAYRETDPQYTVLWAQILTLTLLTLFLLIFLTSDVNFAFFDWRRSCVFLAVLIPSLVILPSAMETRFLLSLQIFILCICFYSVELTASGVLRRLQQLRMPHLVLTGLVVLMFVAITTATSAQMTHSMHMVN